MKYIMIGVVFYFLAACGPQPAPNYQPDEEELAAAEAASSPHPDIVMDEPDTSRCEPTARYHNWRVIDNPHYVFRTLAECEHYDDGD